MKNIYLILFFIFGSFNFVFGDGFSSSSGGGNTAGVSQITAGTNVSIDPSNGIGNVTINVTAGSPGSVLNTYVDNANKVSISSVNFPSSNFVRTTSASSATLTLNPSSVTLYGNSIPANSISSGNLGSSVVASSIGINAVMNDNIFVGTITYSKLKLTTTANDGDIPIFDTASGGFRPTAQASAALVNSTNVYTGQNIFGSNSASTTFKTQVVFSSSIVSNGVSFRLPQSDGTNGQVVKTDGSGNLSFVDQTGGGGGVESTSTTTWTGLNTFTNTISLSSGFAVAGTTFYFGADGTANQILKTDGAGHLSFVTNSGGSGVVATDTTTWSGQNIFTNQVLVSSVNFQVGGTTFTVQNNQVAIGPVSTVSSDGYFRLFDWQNLGGLLATFRSDRSGQNSSITLRNGGSGGTYIGLDFFHGSTHRGYLRQYDSAMYLHTRNSAESLSLGVNNAGVLTITGSNNNVGIGTGYTNAAGVHISSRTVLIDGTNAAIKIGSVATMPTALGNGGVIFSSNTGVTSELFVLDSGGNVTQISPHDSKNGEWIFNSNNSVTGKSVYIPMEEVIADLEKITGKKYIYKNKNEYWESKGK